MSFHTIQGIVNVRDLGMTKTESLKKLMVRQERQVGKQICRLQSDLLNSNTPRMFRVSREDMRVDPMKGA